MIYVRPLAKEEYEELRAMVRKEIGRVSQRAQMVLLSAKHWAVPRIAALYEVSSATVRFWLRKFEKEGPKGLYDESRSGRPHKGFLQTGVPEAIFTVEPEGEDADTGSDEPVDPDVITDEVT